MDTATLNTTVIQRPYLEPSQTLKMELHCVAGRVCTLVLHQKASFFLATTPYSTL